MRYPILAGWQQAAFGFLLLALLLATGPAASAQAVAVAASPAATATAYTGARYVGGPDSLRALLYRAARVAAPGTRGRLLVQFEQKPGGQPQHFKLFPAPGPLNVALITAGAAALDYLQDHMAPWLLAPRKPADDPTLHSDTYEVVLDFSATLAELPYPYADQNPVFSSLAVRLRGQPHEDGAATGARKAFDTYRLAVLSFIQRQVRYPVAALRQQQEGQVWAYFEVAETGAIEHCEIIGTAGSILDAEVLRAVRLLPAATAPALWQGRPVRTCAVAPFNFGLKFSRN